jgi:hypothetical protein
MPHLVDSFGIFRSEHPDLSAIADIDAALRELNMALLFLARLVSVTLADAAKIMPTFGWGTAVRRKGLFLPDGLDSRPLLLQSTKPDHNVMEVVNSCATVERLLDALDWAKKNGCANWSIERCHPTTGTLVLKSGDGKAARFEMSDISGRSVRRNLRSLGVLGGDDLFLVAAAPSIVEENDRGHYLNVLLRSRRPDRRVQPFNAGTSVVLKVNRD